MSLKTKPSTVRSLFRELGVTLLKKRFNVLGYLPNNRILWFPMKHIFKCPNSQLLSELVV